MKQRRYEQLVLFRAECNFSFKFKLMHEFIRFIFQLQWNGNLLAMYRGLDIKLHKSVALPIYLIRTRKKKYIYNIKYMSYALQLFGNSVMYYLEWREIAIDF